MTLPSVRCCWLVATLMIQGTLSGCSGDDKSTAPIPEDPRKTIDGLFQELKDAYEARDITRYGRLFDQENFVFVFDERDVAENPGIPTSWDWSLEEVASRNMFQSDLVVGIASEFEVEDPVAATTQDERDRSFPAGTVKVAIADVSLAVENRDPFGGENLFYRVTGDGAFFFLYPDSSEIVDDVPVWKIFEWRDDRLFFFPTELKSWGAIKYVFRH
ncbi:MAG: hypothetical protein R3E12_13630 [Candidatus Eisenbacteria bacterium]|uniref:Uncharacterized protein n=1 Tax=Eiseniibacteriota bacterium TaxID=2212470 RepID=A0A956M0B5_UNCEI|nr:hypothetical protein [Candidatus Eisenbacteria bacterium]